MAGDRRAAAKRGLLEQLSDEEWRQPSLCAGWTVRDVAAHLTLQQLGLGSPQVSGPMGALLLVCGGRRAALPQLSGEGAAGLAARLSAPPPLPAESHNS